MIEILNRQRRRRVNRKQCHELAIEALRVLKRESDDITIVFVSDTSIKKLNRKFRGQNYATDVLSFPSRAEAFEKEDQSHRGEVVVSIDRAAVQAKENGLTFQNEVQQLILHGLLHLCGYDHEKDHGEMNRLELKLRRKLGI